MSRHKEPVIFDIFEQELKTLLNSLRKSWETMKFYIKENKNLFGILEILQMEEKNKWTKNV